MKRWIGLLALAGCGGAPFSGSLVGPVDDAGRAEAPDVTEAGAEAGAEAAAEAAVDAGVADSGSRDGGVDAVDASCPCVQDLSPVGLGDFSVAFDLTTIAGSGPIVDQRAECDAIKPFWEIELGVGGPTGGAIGKIGYEIADGTSGDSSYAGPVVSDGQQHHVVVSRRAIHTILITVDGAVSSTTTQFGEVLHSLAPLEIGEATACSTTLAATITNVCLTIDAECGK
jgi:hypothetical protein